MAAVLEAMADKPIFENVGQAVHVSFLVMAQEPMQDAPLRVALIRVMESIRLENGTQRNWLDQLRGTPSGSVNFQGLTGAEIRAQCAMVTQAVRNQLPLYERYVLEAKYGQTDYVDVPVKEGGAGCADEKLQAARRAVDEARQARDSAKVEFINIAARAGLGRASSGDKAAARDALDAANDALDIAEREEQKALVIVDQVKASGAIDSGRLRAPGAVVRRYAFSPERIEAIKGLSDYFAPMFPRLNPLAIDCMLGRVFANHKKVDISARDIAESFGGCHKKYLRASFKMKNHIRQLEEQAMERLDVIFAQHGVSCRNEIIS